MSFLGGIAFSGSIISLSQLTIMITGILAAITMRAVFFSRDFITNRFLIKF